MGIEEKIGLFPLFVILLSSVVVCVEGCWVVVFFLVFLIFLHVHVKYIVETSPTSFCSYKPQILYQGFFFLPCMLSTMIYLAQPPRLTLCLLM